MPAPPNALPRRAAVSVALIALAGALLRLAGCFNDLWLDEIWSLARVREMHSALEVFGLHHDNNHLLNSLFLYWMPASTPDWAYRLPAWLTGSIAIVVAALIVRRQVPGSGGAAATLGAVLVGGSYMMIHYGSEARGYGPSVCLSYVAFYCVQRGIDADRSRWSLGYALAISLALLAHAVALHVLGGLAAWSLVRSLRRGRGPAAGVRHWLWWQALPLAATGVLYATHLRHLQIGGGPDHTLLPIIASTAAYTLGLPVGVATSLALPAALLLAAAAMVGQARRGDDVWIAYAVGIFVAPAVILLVADDPLLFERYFISCAALWLLLAADLAASVWQRGARRTVAVAIGLFLIGNGLHTVELLRYGRGAYREALAWVAERTPGLEVTWGSDHNEFRNPLVIGYHAAHLPVLKQWTMIPGPPWQGRSPQWFFEHSQTRTTPEEIDRRDEAGHTYRHVATFRSGPMSGWNWFLFER